ncbi:hypothetical protein MN116_008387 [Schistosoma mekongi]|uniref:Histone-lysine N-methyltransferase SETMAR n=1 Tax=Schistosoma mekongi TaxID=38744 RepID=A0AAE1Z616_SCHME|nr:hypothetical protein MN116_008387 [Schistosoma mekongi]
MCSSRRRRITSFLKYMDILYHEDIPLELITEQLPGCGCESVCCIRDDCACLSKSGTSYDLSGLLVDCMNPIFECNSECVCSQSCTNRVVQRYLKSAESTFESEYHTKACVTDYSIMGKGLKATCDIRRGELVCVYLGEIIPYKEACLREARQLSCYGRNFILIMREYSEGRLVSETCIDGDSVSWGTVKSKARLINHSCTPNLTVVPVRIDSFIPYLALFANQFIKSGTQLSYDYAQSVPTDKIRLSNTPCLCNSDSCRTYMPGV